jgi:D-alanyl-D-alanine carboxypeptidase/D-alanyl-D-alanine-endopeptidase (penicillin-binding protein 4)
MPATTLRSKSSLLALAVVAALAAVVTSPPALRGAAEGATAAASSSSSSTAPSTTTSTSTSTSTTTTTTTTTSTTTTVPPAPPPPGLVDLVIAKLQHPRLAATAMGLSLWVDGVGEVVADNADQPLRPGSTEKLLVAAGALSQIGPDARLTTDVRSAGRQEGPVLHGDLVLVGGGDPTLRSRGQHSLEELAGQLKVRGLAEVAGDLVGDESRYDDRRTAPGWTDFHMPRFVGPLSALAVDGNHVRSDAEYLADPAGGNAAAFGQALERVGIRVTGGVRAGRAAEGSEVLASVASAPLASIVAGMLARSDNFEAELLAKEVGWRATGRGTTADGLAAAAEVLRGLGVRVSGRSADGSGLSRENARPVREWQELLRVAKGQPWGDALVEGLPLAGRTGTLQFRFRGTPAEGMVRAKTGSVRESRALSGYLTTAGGRSVTFSLVLNGPTASAGLAAMDELVAAVVAHPG